jgi:monoamine oxidase
MKRRDFLAAAACAPLVACAPRGDPPLPPGELQGSGLDLGHRLQARAFAAASEVRKIPLLVIGAGIAGLSAGWKLERAGFRDFLIAEMEPEAGGNSRYGENPVSAYPLGGHYLPLPTRESTAVRELLADLGALHGDARAARPVYDELLLCHTPQERLYMDGFWQEGLMPRLGVGAAERAQMARFHEHMAELKQTRDASGRRAFALPLALSSREAKWRDLDRITMRAWLHSQGYDSAHLHWYVNYACRDDYGTDYSAASAWAGLHYFSCRSGAAANTADDTVLTAPSGNGWIVKALAQGLGDRLLLGAMVYRLAQGPRYVEVDAWLAAENRAVRIRAERVIWSSPLFLLPHIAEGLPPTAAATIRAGSYAPWLVANLTLDALPADGAGAPLAWDNVLYGSAGLGYVVATHQRLQMNSGPSVLTYYRALTEMEPQAARKQLLEANREDWARLVLAELGRAHADLPRLTRRLDVFRHGHAMIRPLPGVITAAGRAALAQSWGRVQFAHADVSGLSLFEEANYQGVRAAEAMLRQLGVRHSTSLA